MQHLDTDYVDRLIQRLGSVPVNAVPRWGLLRRDTLIEHLVWSIRHAMGRSRKVPFFGNALTRTVLKPIFLRTPLPLPRNLHLPRHFTDQGITLRDTGDLETLHALLEEYLGLVQADEIEPAPHPVFGPMSIDDWDRFHLRHFEHHCKQFGV